jgi:predicted ATP-binding protein involved in virulence
MSGPPVQSIRLRNFKRFENFYLSARVGNVLVGPNNSGKSSILDALRLASSCLRFARTGPPRPIDIHNASAVLGYKLPDASLPIPIANVATNYSGEDAVIEIRCANGNTLVIRLNPERPTSFYAVTESDTPRTTQAFRKAIPLD